MVFRFGWIGRIHLARLSWHRAVGSLAFASAAIPTVEIGRWPHVHWDLDSVGRGHASRGPRDRLVDGVVSRRFE